MTVRRWRAARAAAAVVLVGTLASTSSAAPRVRFDGPTNDAVPLVVDLVDAVLDGDVDAVRRLSVPHEPDLTNAATRLVASFADDEWTDATATFAPDPDFGQYQNVFVAFRGPRAHRTVVFRMETQGPDEPWRFVLDP